MLSIYSLTILCHGNPAISFSDGMRSTPIILYQYSPYASNALHRILLKALRPQPHLPAQYKHSVPRNSSSLGVIREGVIPQPTCRSGLSVVLVLHHSRPVCCGPSRQFAFTPHPLPAASGRKHTISCPRTGCISALSTLGSAHGGSVLAHRR